MEPNDLITKKDLLQFEERMINRLNEFKQELQSVAVVKEIEFLRSDEMKKLIKVSDNTLRSLRENGSLPFTRLGGVYLYPYEEVMEILKTNTLNK